MSIFHDGCTAGPLSGWLNSLIGECCMAHDFALDRGTDLLTFLSANRAFLECAAPVSGALALAAFIVISSPIGWLVYRFGPKRK